MPKLCDMTTEIFCLIQNIKTAICRLNCARDTNFELIFHGIIILYLTEQNIFFGSEDRKRKDTLPQDSKNMFCEKLKLQLDSLIDLGRNGFEPEIVANFLREKHRRARFAHHRKNLF